MTMRTVWAPYVIQSELGLPQVLYEVGKWMVVTTQLLNAPEFRQR